MFSQASVILFTGEGCLADTPRADTPPLQTPPPPQHTHPGQTPPRGRLLQRTVHILLECILVHLYIDRWHLCRTEWTVSTSWRVWPRASSSRWADWASLSWIRPTNRRLLDSTGSSSCASRSSASSSHSLCAGSSWEWNYREYQSFTARKRSCAKVMFLHLSVSHSVHRGWGVFHHAMGQL